MCGALQWRATRPLKAREFLDGSTRVVRWCCLTSAGAARPVQRTAAGDNGRRRPSGAGGTLPLPRAQGPVRRSYLVFASRPMMSCLDRPAHGGPGPVTTRAASRFLLLPWVAVSNLASAVLARGLGQLVVDWPHHYHEPWLEVRAATTGELELGPVSTMDRTAARRPACPEFRPLRRSPRPGRCVALRRGPSGRQMSEATRTGAAPAGRVIEAPGSSNADSPVSRRHERRPFGIRVGSVKRQELRATPRSICRRTRAQPGRPKRQAEQLVVRAAD